MSPDLETEASVSAWLRELHRRRAASPGETFTFLVRGNGSVSFLPWNTVAQDEKDIREIFGLQPVRRTLSDALADARAAQGTTPGRNRDDGDVG